MADIEITDTYSNMVSIHASSSVINRIAGAYEKEEMHDNYRVEQAEQGADLVTTRSDLNKVLAANPKLKQEIERGMDANSPALSA